MDKKRITVILPIETYNKLQVIQKATKVTTMTETVIRLINGSYKNLELTPKYKEMLTSLFNSLSAIDSTVIELNNNNENKE
jgi:hypothetical protein